MELYEQEGCCGIGNIVGLDEHDNAGEIVKEFAYKTLEGYHTKYNLYIFTDAVKYRRGVNLAAYIRRNKLGTVRSSQQVQGSHEWNVQCWTWAVSWKALNSYAKKHDVSSLHDDNDDNDPYDW